MFTTLPTELQLLTARFCSARSLFSLRSTSRQLCHLVSGCTINVDVAVRVDDDSTGPIHTSITNEWQAVSVLMVIPLAYDFEDFENVGALGAFSLPVNILGECERRLGNYFSPRGPCLRTPRFRLMWQDLELDSPLNPDGALNYALHQRRFCNIRCSLISAAMWARAPRKMTITLTRVSNCIKSEG